MVDNATDNSVGVWIRNNVGRICLASEEGNKKLVARILHNAEHKFGSGMIDRLIEAVSLYEEEKVSSRPSEFER